MSLDPRLEQLYVEVLEIVEQRKTLARKYYNNLREIAAHPYGTIFIFNRTIPDCIEAIDEALEEEIETVNDSIRELSKCLEKSRRKAERQGN